MICTMWKDPMANFRKTRRQSEGRPTVSFHGNRQQHNNQLGLHLQGQCASHLSNREPNVGSTALIVGLAISAPLGNDANARVRTDEETNNINRQKLLRKRTQTTDNARKATVVECCCDTNVMIHKPTKGVNDNKKSQPRPRPNINVRVSSLSERGASSGPGHSNSIVTLSSLKHLPNHSATTLPIGKTKKTPTVRKGWNRTMSHTSNYGSASNPARPVGQGQDSNNPSGHPQGAEGQSNTPQRHGSYTLIPPNSTKRNTVLTQASKEAAEYEKYKEGRRVNYVKTTPQSVGGNRSEEEARMQRVKEARDKKYEMIMKRKKWEEEKKAREEAEYREKKERAREQTRRNQQRRQERQNMWTEDHRRTNEAFLRRLEQQKNLNMSS